MSRESIVEKIISDAKTEAAAIISEAEKSAEATIARANLFAERKITGVRAETAQKVKSILDGKSASARLDCAKIKLGEKRRVIDALYEQAFQALISLDKKQTVALSKRLLEQYADECDEIVFSSGFKYIEDVIKLDVVKEKKLTHSVGGAIPDGGFILKGKVCDKDISYRALLLIDREQNVSLLAEKLFNQG